MKRLLQRAAVLLPVLLLSGCAPTEKSANLSAVYAVMAVLSLLLLIGCCLMQKKNMWLILLFASVVIVNAGYLTLAISGTLEEALLANRISYLGSVFLPLSMLMIILEATGVRYAKWLPICLVIISLGVFLVAASPGYLDIYYKEVSIESVNGFTVLNKVYGPWHKLYFFYLAFYFMAMVGTVAHAIITSRITSAAHAVVLAFAVLVNIGVWLIEQMVQIDFELLSVSYVISELFLLGQYMMLQEENKKAVRAAISPEPVQQAASSASARLFVEQCQSFMEGLHTLTPTERTVYDLYLEGKSTREIMDALNIKENTLKYHNRNLYGKLGVSSRRQLVDIAKTVNQEVE